MDTSYTEKRSNERIATALEVRFYSCSRIHSGRAMNISAKGMFISIEELCFPFDSHFEVVLYAGESMLRCPVNLIRVEMSPQNGDGIGVELTRPLQQYLDFVSSLKSA